MAPRTGSCRKRCLLGAEWADCTQEVLFRFSRGGSCETLGSFESCGLMVCTVLFHLSHYAKEKNVISVRVHLDIST